MKLLKWVLCLYIAVVFIQSLFFKFTDAHETVHIFTTLGDWSGFQWFGQYGAYIVGSVELVAALLLLTSFRLYGAILAMGVMSGAIFFHLFTPLGIKMPEFNSVGAVVGDDGGLLFYNACGIFVTATVVAIHEFYTTENKLKSVLCACCKMCNKAN